MQNWNQQQSQRECFYCKQYFSNNVFDSHIRNCPSRGNNYKNNNQKNNNNNNNEQKQWKCNLCTYMNSMSTRICVMCQQGKRPVNFDDSSFDNNNNNRPKKESKRDRYKRQREQNNNNSRSNSFQNGNYNNNSNDNNNYHNSNNSMNGYHNHNNNNNNSNNNSRQPQPQQDEDNDTDMSGGPDYWQCARCTFLNPKVAPTCVICSDPKPSIVKKRPPPQPKPQHPPLPNEFNFGDSNSNNNNSFNNNNNNNFNNNHNINNDKLKKNPEPMLVDTNNNNNSNNSDDEEEEEEEIPQGMDRDTYLMLKEFMCAVCLKEPGFEGFCHKLCGGCAKKHFLQGILRKRWEKEDLVCPVKKCGRVLPSWLVKRSGLGDNYIKEIEKMQQKYLLSQNPNMTQCPKCKNYFMTEQGDIKNYNKNEKGLDGKPLTQEAHIHKSKYRFRCDCKTIFCGGCKAVPYHLGYTCEQWKSYQEAKKCRFCEVQLTSKNTAARDWNLGEGLKNVCNNKECLEKRRWSCDKILNCGHNCIGIRAERKCLPCLHKDCVNDRNKVNSDEFCNICWVDPLFAAPTIKLNCGHHFHFTCVYNKMDNKWPGARITFGFLNCPLCKKPMQHPSLNEISRKHYQLKRQIIKDAIERIKIEGLENDKRLKDPNSPYFGNMEKFACDRLAFYMCYKCKKPYFGGMKACEEAGMQQSEKYKKEHLVCGSCAAGPNSKSCKKHGRKYITYKCKFCCSVSTWFCWGNTHFCDSCHKKQESGIYLNRKPISELPKCPGPDKCPLGVDHPPNGVEEFSLGCVVCLRR